MTTTKKDRSDLKQEYGVLCQKRQELFKKLTNDGMIGQALWNDPRMKTLHESCNTIGDTWRALG